MVADAFCDIISRTVRFMQAQKKFTVAVALILSASEKEENKVNRRSEREQSQVYLNYAKPQGGKQS